MAKCSFSLTSKTISITWYKSEASKVPSDKAISDLSLNQTSDTLDVTSSINVEENKKKEETSENCNDKDRDIIVPIEAAKTTESIERDPVDALFDSSGNSENLAAEC